MPLRFPRGVRLLRAVEFRTVLKTGKKTNTSLFSFYRKENNLPFARLGITITKKNVRNAASRNRVKRIIRESFRYNQTLLTGLDVVVYAHKPVSDLSKKQLRDFLDQTWLKLVSYKKSSLLL